MIDDTNTKLTQLNEFLTFIEEVVQPQLQQRDIPVIPIKRTLFIDSINELKNKVIERLTKCKRRIAIQAPSILLKDIEVPLLKAIRRLERLEKKKEKISILFIDNSRALLNF